jgi:hypothetical protein
MAGPPLLDDIWTRRGISLIWDAEALAKACKPQQVVSLRRFLYLHSLGWPEKQTPLVDERVLVVAGLEAALDALGAGEATEWVRSSIYKALISFQSDVADGGAGAAVVLWFTDGRRFQHQASDDSYEWKWYAGNSEQSLPLGRCLFNGAQKDLQEIRMRIGADINHWVGLYHPRIS